MPNTPGFGNREQFIRENFHKLHETVEQETKQNMLNVFNSDKPETEKLKCIEKVYYNMRRRMYIVLDQKTPPNVMYRKSTDL